MKSFLAILSEKQPASLNETLLKMHIEYLQTIRQKNHLPMCGPFTDNKSAMMVIRADSLMQAQELVQNDPFIRANYYNNFVVHEFTEAGAENNWLADSDQTLGNIKD